MMQRVQTGVRVFDTALAGGIPCGLALLLVGEEGAGATEFALAFARHAAAEGGRSVRIVSALRSRRRIEAECHALFEEEGEKAAHLDIRAMDAQRVAADPASILEDLKEGDLLFLESADTLAKAGDAAALPALWRAIADAAGERGIIVLLLHSPGTLPPAVEVALSEEADGVLRFSWHETGPARRRALSLMKLRGLAPMLDGSEVPVFEVALHRGVGFTISRGRSVL